MAGVVVGNEIGHKLHPVDTVADACGKRTPLQGGIRFRDVRGAILATALIALGAALILYIPRYWVADLGPLPDAAEYTYAAHNLAHLRPYTIALYHGNYPPRYPFGFPILLAPFYWLPQSTLANGIYGVLAMGIATTVLVYALARRIGGQVAGIGAAVALLLAPQLMTWSHEVMSETATMAITAASALLVYQVAGEDKGRRRQILLASIGILAGFALLIRLTNIALVVAVVLALLCDQRFRSSSRREIVLVGIGPVLALAGLAVYARVVFGSVMGTGYRYWVPDWFESLGRTFSPSYAISAPGITGDPFAPTGMANLAYYGRSLSGLLPLHSLNAFSPWFMLLTLLGWFALARDRRRPPRTLVVFGGAFVILTLGLYGLYFFQSVRFMAPVMPLLSVGAGLGAAAGVRLLRDRPRWPASMRLGAGIAVATVAGLGVITTLVPMLDTCYLYQWYVRRNPDPYVIQHQARTAALYQAAVPDAGIIVSDIYPLILEGVPVAQRATIIPLSRDGYLQNVHLEDVPVFRKRQSEVNSALHARVPVFTDNYTLGLLSRDPHLDRAHEALRSYGRIAVAQDGPLIVYRLTATAASENPPALDPLLTAFPNPVPSGTGFGATTIAWDTGDGSMGQIYVSYDGSPERLFDEGESGERAISWIGGGSRYTFTLYRGTTHQTMLTTMTVTRL